MTNRLLSSVFPVRSTDDANSAFGTSYVIKNDTSTTYLVTCAHVVRDVGGDGKVLVGKGQEARVLIHGSPEGADDVAVLITNRIPAPPLPLAFNAERGRRVSVVGYRQLQSQSRLLTVVPVDATLGSPIMLDSREGTSFAW
jgi:S1-C subfamily serine protease